MPSAEQLAWLKEYIPLAKEICGYADLPPRVMLAQMALESRWGKSIPINSNNYLGIKYRWRRHIGAVASRTKEDFGEGLKPTTESFAKFYTVRECFVDWTYIINKAHPQTAQAWRETRNETQLVSNISGWYGTDGQYRSILLQIHSADYWKFIL